LKLIKISNGNRGANKVFLSAKKKMQAAHDNNNHSHGNESLIEMDTELLKE
jgi:hypothetical protein